MIVQEAPGLIDSGAIMIPRDGSPVTVFASVWLINPHMSLIILDTHSIDGAKACYHSDLRVYDDAQTVYSAEA